MSTNLNYKQAVNVTRRTWDVESYENRAKERAKNDTDGTSKRKERKKGPSDPDPDYIHADQQEETKEEFVPAAAGAAGPHKSKRAFLKARQRRVDVDSKIGSVEMVNPEAAATTKANALEGVGGLKNGVTKTGVGWHCKVCDCFLRDSHTYLDHINGKKHQRNLGYSMRVERSTTDQVASRLAQLAKEQIISKTNEVVEENFYDIVKAKDEEAKRLKEERAQRRKERKQKKKEDKAMGIQPQNTENQDAQEQEDDEEEGAVDPDLAAMMGFSGFGGGNKNT